MTGKNFEVFHFIVFVYFIYFFQDKTLRKSLKSQLSYRQHSVFIQHNHNYDQQVKELRLSELRLKTRKF